MAKDINKPKIKAAVERKKREAYAPVTPDMQLGFIHNNVDCIGCRACEIASKDKNGLPPGPRFRRVQYVEDGTYPDVYTYKVNMSCSHWAEPACPTGAIFKRQKDGVVDIDSTLCIGCRRCEAACPSGRCSLSPSRISSASATCASTNSMLVDRSGLSGKTARRTRSQSRRDGPHPRYQRAPPCRLLQERKE